MNPFVQCFQCVCAYFIDKATINDFKVFTCVHVEMSSVNWKERYNYEYVRYMESEQQFYCSYQKYLLQNLKHKSEALLNGFGLSRRLVMSIRRKIRFRSTDVCVLSLYSLFSHTFFMVTILWPHGPKWIHSVIRYPSVSVATFTHDWSLWIPKKRLISIFFVADNGEKARKRAAFFS